jgi:uncharacterized integral membrane protein (TIGR00697 family)
MTALLLLTAIEAGLIAYASASLYRLRGLVVINMVLITLLAAKQIEVLGFTSNLGNALYVGVMTAQTITLAAGRRDVALGNKATCYFALLAVVLLGGAVGFAPVVPGNESLAFAIDAVTGFAPRVVVASFLAFALSQYVLIHGFDYLGRWPLAWRCLAIQIVAQGVDSAVFFPCAFLNDSNGGAVIEMALTGFAVKVALTALLLPLLFLPGIGRKDAKS